MENQVFASGRVEKNLSANKVSNIEETGDDYSELGIFDSSKKNFCGKKAKPVETGGADFGENELFGFGANILLGDTQRQKGSLDNDEVEFNMFEGLDDFVKKNVSSGNDGEKSGNTAKDEKLEEMERKMLSGQKLSSKKGYDMYGSMPKFEQTDDKPDSQEKITIDKNILSIFTD